jgi:hypothetical protein
MVGESVFDLLPAFYILPCQLSRGRAEMCLALSGPQRQTVKDQSVKTLLVTKKCVLQSRGQRHQFLLKGPSKNKDGLVQVAVKAKVLCPDGTRKLLCQSTKVFQCLEETAIFISTWTEPASSGFCQWFAGQEAD